MPPDRNPFAGMRLGEEATETAPAGGGLDRQLFTPRPAQHPSAADSDSPRAPSIPAARPIGAPALHVTFDLRRRPLYKLTYLYTEEETKALDALRDELADTTDERVTKTDLLRAALHLLVEDHVTRGADSYVTRKLTRRRG